MAELATIARPYANALFGAGKDSLEVTAEWLQNVAGLAESADVQAFVASPKVREEQVLELFQKGVRAGLPERGVQFLRLLVRNGRVPALPEIARQFAVLKNAYAGTAEAAVTSAYEMSVEQENALREVLEKRFDKKLTLKVRVDESLIGGVRVQVGDEVLDTSVHARLAQLRQGLST